MYSCQSPVKTFTGISSAVGTNSPIKSKVSISLNGLFGEASDLDEHLSVPLSSHCPNPGTLSSSRVALSSPSKSPNSVLNHGGQPVLLSELADCMPYHGTSGGPFHRATLCSFISQYDNSRCTNLAAATCGIDKSYCRNHLELARPIEVTTSLPYTQHNNTTTAHSMQTREINTTIKPFPVRSQYSGAEQSKFNSESRNITMGQVNAGVSVLRSQNNVLPASVDVTDGSTPAFPHPVASNVIFPISYLTTTAQVVNASSSKAQKLLHMQNSAQDNHYNPAVGAKGVLKNTNSNRNAAARNMRHGVNNTAVQMDGDVLQAFLDFLNQNQANSLSPKQQIEVLKSLNFVVASTPSAKVTQGQVVNLTQNNGLKLPPTQGSYSGICSNQGQPGIRTSAFVSSTGLNRNCSAVEFQKTNSLVLTGENVMLSTQSQKRKNPNDPFLPPVDSKRTRRDIEIGSNSLQHLSPSQLDERVLEALASVDRISSTGLQPITNQILSEKFKIKASGVGKNKVNSRKIYKKESSVPSVPIPVIPSFDDNLTSDTLLNEPLKAYVQQRIDSRRKSQILFPLGPFCDDKDFGICSCPIPFHKLPLQTSIKKQKSSKIPNLKSKRCKSCRQLGVPHYLLTFADHVLKSTSKLQVNSSMLQNTTKLPCSGDPTLSKATQKVTTSTFASNDPVKNMYCRHLNKSAKVWKRMCKKENNAIRLLIDAARSNMKETKKVLNQLGTKPVSCSKRRGFCAEKSSRCALTDRTGYQCKNIALPLAIHCHDHILHSNHQQLYKLGSSAKVVADIFPDPPTVRQRKKTKLPPLSRKKKRKKKTPLAKLVKLGSKLSALDTMNATDAIVDVETTSKQDSNLPMQPTTHNSIDTNDCDVPAESSSGSMSLGITDLPLSQKLHPVNDSLPLPIDEESNSGIFEAFNLDGTELLSDVIPDMFSDFDLFNGKNGEVLDNALLLAGASDPDCPGKINLDKLSFEELSENGMFFSTSTDHNDTITNDLLSQSAEGCNKSNTESSQMSSSSTVEENTPCLPDMFYTSSQSVTSSVTSCNLTSSNAILTSSTGVVESLKWPSNDDKVNQDIRFDSTTGLVNLSSSLESSLVDDLNELEGVIQSLQDESDNAKLQTVSTTDQQNFNADEFTSNLARELSMDIEKVEFGPPSSVVVSQPTSWNDETYFSKQSSQFQTVSTVKSLPTLVNSTIDDLAIQCTVRNPLPRKQRNAAGPTKLGPDPNNPDLKINQRQKPAKKSKKKSPKKRQNSVVSLPITQILPSLSEDQVKSQHQGLHAVGTASADAAKHSAPTRLTTKSSSNLIIDFDKGRKQQKPSVSGSYPQVAHPVFALNSPLRMQPKLVAGNIVCSAGKINSSISNQSMVLIPIHAVVRSGNHTSVQGNGQGLGIAFAIPAQDGFSNNVGTVIPIRGSAVLSGSNNTQQLLILGGNQTAAAPVSTTSSSSNQSRHVAVSTTVKAKQPKDLSSVSHVTHGAKTSKVPSQLGASMDYSSQCAPNQLNAKSLSKQTLQTSVSNVAKTSSSKPAVSRVSTQLPASSTVSLPVKDQTFLSQTSRIVIPPARKEVNSDQSGQIETVSKATPATSLVKTGGTVHWNQSMDGPDTPSPQPRLYGTLGGQTANMLYCRRISPSLNNTQHVVVGRLGSLGRMGLSRVSVADHPKNNDAVPQTASAVRPDANKAITTSSNEACLPAPLRSTHGFIQLSPSLDKSVSNAQPTTTSSEGGGACGLTPPGLVVPSGAADPPRKDTNPPNVSSFLHGNPLPNNGITAIGNSFPTLVNSGKKSIIVTPLVKASSRTSVSIPTVRHNSRKSDHTTMLEDPDFQESPIKVTTSSKNVLSSENANLESNFSTRIKRINTKIVPPSNEASSSSSSIASERSIKEDDRTSLIGGKASRRATILRKNR